MNGVLPAEWIKPVLVTGVVIVITCIVPAIWLAAKKRSLDGFVRVWYPIAVAITATSGIVVIEDTWNTKLILIGILAPIAGLAGYFSSFLYLWLKRSFKL